MEERVEPTVPSSTVVLGPRSSGRADRGATEPGGAGSSEQRVAGATDRRAAPAWKEAFTSEVDQLFNRRLRVGTSVLMLLHGGAFAVFPNGNASSLASALQIALIPFTAILFGLTFWRAVGSLVRSLAALMIVTVAAYAAWKNCQGGGDPLDSRALTLTIVTAGLLFPFGLWETLGLSLSILAFYILGAKLTGAPGGEAFAGGVFFLVAATILATVSARLTSRLREKEFRGRHALQIANEQNESLLRNMLPEATVARPKQEGGSVADRHAEATVMFADIVGFTKMSAALSPELLVRFLNDLFSRIDALTTKHGLEKIKTIGDAYMAAGGLPEPRPDHAEAVARLALDMRALVAGLVTPHGEPLSVRIGIHTGPLIAGVIGATKLTYDLWGDTVNTASRMESHAEPGMIQVSEATHALLVDKFRLAPRGTIQVKGKGPMEAFALIEAL